MFYVNVLYLSIEIRCLRSVQNHLDEQQCWVVDFFIECLKYIFTFQELITKDIIKNKAKGLRMLFVGKAQCSFKKKSFLLMFLKARAECPRDSMWQQCPNLLRC